MSSPLIRAIASCKEGDVSGLPMLVRIEREDGFTIDVTVMPGGLELEVVKPSRGRKLRKGVRHIKAERLIRWARPGKLPETKDSPGRPRTKDRKASHLKAEAKYREKRKAKRGWVT